MPLTRPKSDALFEEAKPLMPGGVNSPVRAFGSVGGGTPVMVERAEGPYLYDVDGNEYIDLVCTWGPAILGHRHPEVVDAVKQAADKGLSFGCPTEGENRLAELVIDAVPSIEMVRFVNSGTEAAMSALRLARAATGRKKIIKFAGCYHGHADFLLVQAGSGASAFGMPNSAGVPDTTVKDTLTAQYNDLPSVEALFAEYPEEVAAIAVEPVAGNMGCILPQPGFLQGLRDLCDKHGAVLLFDEVMTGFRVAYGGAQAHYGVTPDVTCLGKIVGGGMPVGAYGGRKDLMELVAPLGPMYQAGTLSGHPLGMAAGAKTLEILKRDNPYPGLSERAKRLADGLMTQAKAQGLEASAQQVGAMFSLFFSKGPVTGYADVTAIEQGLFNRFFWALLERGIYWPPSKFEACFTSVAHTDAICDVLLERSEAALKSLFTGSPGR